MQGSQAADLAILICCVVAILAYNTFYFRVRSFAILGRRYANLYALNKESRAEWVLVMSADSKEGINAVQSVRNLVLAVSVLAASTAALASSLIQVITDTAKLDQVAEFAKIDPISSLYLISPPVKLGIALGVLFLAVMAFAQSVRLAVHIGFTLRVVAADPSSHSHRALRKQTVVIMKRSSLYFAIGLRCLFMFGPALSYMLGPTALLITTVLYLGALVLFDVVPAAECEEDEGSGADVPDGQPAGAKSHAVAIGAAGQREHPAAPTPPPPPA